MTSSTSSRIRTPVFHGPPNHLISRLRTTSRTTTTHSGHWFGIRACGNYCGARWCGGEQVRERYDFDDVFMCDFSAPTLFCEDECCKAHDSCCGSNDRRDCNYEMLQCTAACAGGVVVQNALGQYEFENATAGKSTCAPASPFVSPWPAPCKHKGLLVGVLPPQLASSQQQVRGCAVARLAPSSTATAKWLAYTPRRRTNSKAGCTTCSPSTSLSPGSRPSGSSANGAATIL